MESRSRSTFRFMGTVVVVGIGCWCLLWLPAVLPMEYELLMRLGVAIAALGVFIRLGFKASAVRTSLGMVLLLFTAGLLVELGSFAYLYQQDGVLAAVTVRGNDGKIQIAFEEQKDLTSCFLMSVHVWTSVGYGSFMPNPKQGWLTALEMLLGYAYMAIFIAILVAVLQQYFEAAVNDD